MTTLTVAATTDFRSTVLSNVTNINYTNGLGTTATATFAATQFNGAQIATNVTFTGSIGRNIVAVTGASNFDASSWQFVNWLGTDTVTITGTSASDTITGSSVADTVSAGNGNDVIRGGGGLDRLAGGGGNDTFVYGAASELVAGEEIHGGTSAGDSGTADAIRVSASGTQVDFTTATITGIEQLNFDGVGGHSVKFNEAQLFSGGGSIATVNGSIGNDEVEVVMAGGAISLADLVVNGFGTSGNDRFVISGGTAAGGESYIGSDADDLILSSGGTDVIAGGLGHDTFRLQNAGHTGGFIFLGSSLVEPDTGTDTIEVNSAGNYDLTTAGLAGIDRLQFTGLSNVVRTVTLDADQVGAGAINAFNRASGGNANTTTDTVVISGGSIDLSTAVVNGIDSFTLNGSTGNDLLAAPGSAGNTINGLDGDDTISGGTGNDALNGGAGNDTFVYNNQSRVGQGSSDAIDAGTGANDRILFAITTGTAEDFSVATIAGIDRFEFGGGDTTIQTARLSAAQLLAIVNVAGDAGDDVIQVTSGGTVNLSTLNVTNFTSNELVGVTLRQADRIEFNGGTSGADVFTGSNASDLMTTSGGSDVLSSGNGNDKIVVANAAHLATAQINLGAGTFDILELQGSGTFALNNNHIGFEKLSFTGGAKTVTMGSSHFGSGKVNFVTSTGGTSLIVAGNSNLSGVTFGSWGGTDSITQNGTTADNTIVGSSRNDTINGDLGNDTLTGGLGVDVLNGGGGNDRFLLGNRNDTLTSVNAGQSGDQFNGGSETDTIIQNFAGGGTVGTSDMTFSTFDSIETYEFGGASSLEQHADFLQSQVGAGASRIGSFVGNAGNDTVQILYQGGDLSLAALGLTNWTDGADLLFVNALASAVGGNATLTGSAFGDRFEMGLGASTTNDTIEAGDGNDVVLANGGNDIIDGGNGADTISGGDGNDTITGGAAADILTGGTGTDVFIINAGDFVAGESINGGVDASTDTIRQIANGTVDYTLGTIETIEAFEFAGTAAQTAIFDDFDRPLIFDGNVQINNLVFNMDAPGTFNFGGTFTNWSANDTITLNGSVGNDTITGSQQRETLNGGDGDDILRSSEGIDNFDGGIGNDTVQIQDTAHFGAGQILSGGAGTADRLTFISAGGGAIDLTTATISGFEQLRIDSNSGLTVNTTNTHFAASGINVIEMVGAGTNVLNISGGSVDLSGVDVSGVLGQIHLTGSATANAITGSSGRETIDGLAGDDTIFGGDGADILIGGDGNDTFLYTNGSQVILDNTFDNVDGGIGTQDKIRQDAAGAVDYSNMSISGVELFSFTNTVGTQTATYSSNHILAGGIGRFVGDAGVNELVIRGTAASANINLSTLVLSAWTNGTDIVTVNGGGNVDTITGSAFRDVLNGGDGGDTIDGGSGNDTINGGAGFDRIIGGLGIDELTGGADSQDTFVLQSSASHLDFITDFVSTVDHLEVSAAAFGGGLSAFVGLFNPNLFVANATGLAGDADDRFIYNTATRELTFDSNGNAGGGARLIATFAAGTPDLVFTDINIVA